MTIDGIISALDPETGERLGRCLPMFSAAIDRWCVSSERVPQGSFMLAAATPNSGVVLHAPGWPVINQTGPRFSRDTFAIATARAIDSETYAGDIIIAGVAALLGARGVAICKADAAAMWKPLHVVLINDSDEPGVSWLITTVELVLH
jgi:hypothetical protein